MQEPIYQQIIAELKKRIESLPANTAIASERELSEQLGASRMTIRKAIRKLVDDGYLYRDSTRGTFVADQKLHKKQIIPVSLDDQEEVPQQYRVIYFDVKNDVDEIAVKLGIKTVDRFVRLVRLNLNDERVPESIEEIYIVHQLLEEQDLTDINELLKFGTSIDAASVHQEFTAMTVPIQYAKFLEIDMNTPIIVIDTTIYTKSAKVGAYIKSYINPNVKKIEIIT